VRDADEPVAKAEGENHFGRSGQKRNEAQFIHQNAGFPIVRGISIASSPPRRSASLERFLCG
jgi:hypothetical protein